jgi:hypothetical protein
MTLLYLAQDGLSRLRPDERLCFRVMLGYKFGYRFLKVADAPECSTTDSFVRDLREKTLDGIEPR